ncbi:MAG: alpha/beta hydrolase [Lachnospiraceae bacterium]|nr:alpha/beta hydrolase [Lachnospiraceae bacterium]
MKKMDMPSKKGLGWIITAVVLLAMAAFCVWYVNDYYHAEDYVDAYLQSSDTVTVTTKDNIVFLDGAGTEDAMIFYPGAKVEYTAYVPLFYALAEQGVDCFVVKMPGNLAFFGMGKAADIMEEYEYENWYLSGHSLGGAMAASYITKNGEDFDGLVLLAAYATKDLPEHLSMLSVYGSEDKVVNMEKVEAGRAYVPADYTEVCLEGGNHAWFAYYGEQEGDGTAYITKENQQQKTVDVILETIKKDK